MKSANQTPIANSLLAALPKKDYRNLIGNLELVRLRLGDILHESGATIEHVYFPNDCVVSLLAVAEDRMTLEVGLVGNEGMVGIAVAMGSDVSPVRALVQRTGTLMRMPASSFRNALNQSQPLQRGISHYSHGLMLQATQTAFCSRFHLLEARLARSLLMTRDRVHSGELHLTHEFLAHALGVRRVGITKAAGALQQRKLISYSRGDIRILDPEGLEEASCSCYQVVKHNGVIC